MTSPTNPPPHPPEQQSAIERRGARFSARWRNDGNGAAVDVRERRLEAEQGSLKLLTACLRYGVKHGLPNLYPHECKERLEAL